MVRFLVFFMLYSLLNADSLITPIPKQIAYNESKAKLGKKLFLDARLSSDGTVSCEKCHQLYWSFTGTDGLPVSRGVNGRLGKLNSPTVLNVAFNFRQFWDGRVKTLEEQIIMPLTSDFEMDNTVEKVIQRLNRDPKYKEMFFENYKDGITFDNMKDAIVEFERALITPDSNFDRFLRGDKFAINDEEKEGYQYFKQLGCVSCHNGVNLGGNLFQKFGVFEPYPHDDNLGRYNITKKEKDKYYFKVPTLRNIARTAPYLHNGSIPDLKKVIEIMAYYQLGTYISDKQRDAIYAFLLTLNGKKPEILNEQ